MIKYLSFVFLVAINRILTKPCFASYKDQEIKKVTGQIVDIDEQKSIIVVKWFNSAKILYLEQMYKKKYHFYVNTVNLYNKLKNIITNTDLCTHCPRAYRDHLKISL